MKNLSSETTRLDGTPLNRQFALLLAVAVFFVLILTTTCAAQNKIVILVRHAEKDVSESADKNDPELTVEGRQRAERLAQVVKRYKPGAVYSTDLKRTRDTAAPIAARRRLAVQTYDARKPGELIDAVMKSRTKRFLVVGHSNTIPDLANAIGKKELFRNLDESEYGTIWVIRIKGGRVEKIEILPY